MKYKRITPCMEGNIPPVCSHHKPPHATCNFSRPSFRNFLNSISLNMISAIWDLTKIILQLTKTLIKVWSKSHLAYIRHRCFQLWNVRYRKRILEERVSELRKYHTHLSWVEFTFVQWAKISPRKKNLNLTVSLSVALPTSQAKFWIMLQKL